MVSRVLGYHREKGICEKDANNDRSLCLTSSPSSKGKGVSKGQAKSLVSLVGSL